MITNTHIWQQWEDEFYRREPPSFETNMRLMEAMFKEAVELGAFAPCDPLGDIETKIRLAHILNCGV